MAGNREVGAGQRLATQTQLRGNLKRSVATGEADIVATCERVNVVGRIGGDDIDQVFRPRSNIKVAVGFVVDAIVKAVGGSSDTFLGRRARLDVGKAACMCSVFTGQGTICHVRLSVSAGWCGGKGGSSGSGGGLVRGGLGRFVFELGNHFLCLFELRLEGADVLTGDGRALGWIDVGARLCAAVSDATATEGNAAIAAHLA